MAVDRLTPTSGPMTGSNYAAAVNEEVAALWERAVCTLTAVAGTNTITATCTPSYSSLVNGMMFILKPAATNTSTVTLNINGGGAIAVRDAEDGALTAGALRINGNYLLKYDSTFVHFVIVNYVPQATLSPGMRLLATVVTTGTVNSLDFFNGATATNGGTGTNITASGTVVLDDTYDSYMFDISMRPTTDDVELWLRVGTGGTPTYQTTNYRYTGQAQHDSATAKSWASTSDSEIVLAGTNNAAEAVGNASGEQASLVLYFRNPEATDIPFFHGSGGYINAGGETLTFTVAARRTTAVATTAIRFLFESGTIASGSRVTLYGLTKV